jgi:ubiquinone/menaquinone biosynthesis C-methylase UbiE
MNSFQPKQITQYRAQHLTELQGDVSETVIRYSLDLLPPFAAGSVVHDNACGSGAVTETVMEKSPPDIHIYATDINPEFVNGCASLAGKHGWPVETAVMSAQELTFPDEKFTHTFTSFAFHCVSSFNKQILFPVKATAKCEHTSLAIMIPQPSKFTVP